MSKKKRNTITELNVNDAEKPSANGRDSLVKNSSASGAMSSGWWNRSGKLECLTFIGIGLLLVSAVLGATGLGKRIADALSGNSTNQTARNTSQSLTLNPVMTGTPQLSKEYIYAGSRLLAVDDAGANGAPPADLAVWRPSSGYWYVMGAGGSIQASQQWGASGDVTVPGDYDGDGKTDFCVFRPAPANSWYVIKSSDGNWYGIQFAASGDIPVPADYDGDGKTDIAVYRPSNGTWYVVKSSDPNNYIIRQFGLLTDKPAPADYDGDGKADIGIWRGSSFTFYSVKSSNGQLHVGEAVGQTTNDVPVSADYDGDGRADFAVKSGNNWIIKQSSNNQQISIPWQAGETAVQNDYDGDGKVDIAVWRDSNGDWYIRQSSRIGQNNELRQEHWGQSGDVAVPIFYRR